MTLPAPRVFRWIRVGNTYRYQPRLGTGLDERRGEPCTVQTIARHNLCNCLIEGETAAGKSTRAQLTYTWAHSNQSFEWKLEGGSLRATNKPEAPL